MAEIIIRKCKECKQPIQIEYDNIHDVIIYQNLYYHKDCFIKMAENKANSTNKRTHPDKWKDILDNVSELEKETKVIVKNRKGNIEAKDELNAYLLSHYNIISVDSQRFWQVIADLNKGIYKNKRCKKVSTQLVLDTWKWGQHKLDDIYKRNRMKNIGPENDSQRIAYDLAVVVKHIPDYMAYAARQEALAAEAKTNASRINYDNMQRVESQTNGLDDISALLDEF